MKYQSIYWIYTTIFFSERNAVLELLTELTEKRTAVALQKKTLEEKDRSIELLLNQVQHFQKFFCGLIGDMSPEEKLEMVQPIENKVLCKVKDGYLWYHLGDINKKGEEKGERENEEEVWERGGEKKEEINPEEE